MWSQKLIQRFTTSSQLLDKLITRVPKEVEVDVSPGFLSLIFEQTKKSPTYLLLKEVFLYLKESPILENEFPLIKSEERFEQNWMALHLQILKARLKEEKGRSEAINELELQKFNYNAQAYFFSDYSRKIHPQMPVNSFTSHFAEAYLKKFKVFEEHFEASYEERPTQEVLQGLLRKLVYENRVSLKDSELMKLSKYYIAHRRYLSMLAWPDMLEHKIKWGFQEEKGMLDHLSTL